MRRPEGGEAVRVRRGVRDGRRHLLMERLREQPMSSLLLHHLDLCILWKELERLPQARGLAQASWTAPLGCARLLGGSTWLLMAARVHSHASDLRRDLGRAGVWHRAEVRVEARLELSVTRLTTAVA